MQQIIILLIIVSILTLLAGTIILFGSKKDDRARSFWFFVSTVFATIWTTSIAFFFMADQSWSEIIDWHINWIYVSAIFIDIALLGYISWRNKIGKIITIISLIFGTVLSVLYVNNPKLLYEEVVFGNSGANIIINVNPFYFVYIAFFCALIPIVILTLLYQIFSSKSPKKKGGDIVLLIGFSISGVMSAIFDLILPFWRWDLSWIGPLTVSTTIIAVYYSTLRYKSLNLHSAWLKIFSYIVIITSAAIIYMLIFSMIFAALFRGSSPSTEVIILNFIMILIVICLLPAISEISMFIRSLISDQRIDIVYIIRKLMKVNPKNTDLKELAGFLADHMHLEYIGFLIDGQIYGSAPRSISAEGISLISKLDDPEDGVWQRFDKNSETWKTLGLETIAALRDGTGKTFGQVMIGKPHGKISFYQRNLVQIETIIDLTSVIVNSKYKSHKKS